MREPTLPSGERRRFQSSFPGNLLRRGFVGGRFDARNKATAPEIESDLKAVRAWLAPRRMGRVPGLRTIGFCRPNVGILCKVLFTLAPMVAADAHRPRGTDGIELTSARRMM